MNTNSKNSQSTIKDGKQVKGHKALKFFNLADYEKRDVKRRDSNVVNMKCTEDIFIKRIMSHLEETTESAQAYLDYEV